MDFSSFASHCIVPVNQMPWGCGSPIVAENAFDISNLLGQQGVNSIQELQNAKDALALNIEAYERECQELTTNVAKLIKEKTDIDAAVSSFRASLQSLLASLSDLKVGSQTMARVPLDGQQRSRMTLALFTNGLSRLQADMHNCRDSLLGTINEQVR